MVFWLIVGLIVAAVLFLCWRMDRKHKVTIDRRNGAVESDIARGYAEAVTHHINGGGGFGTL